VRYLLDSNVIAAAIKGRLPVVLRLSELKPGDVAIAAVSRVEAETALKVQARAQVRYGKLLRDFIAQVRVIDFGALESQAAVTLAATLRNEGEPIAPFDLLVAATALAHRLTLVTDRPAAFSVVPNLEVENWLNDTNRISQGKAK